MQIKILLVEDVPEDIRFVELQLQELFGDGHTLIISEYFSNALQLSEKNTFDVILLDLSLPDSKGLTNFRKLLKSTSTPVIVHTSLSDESIKSEAIKLGAKDYLIKGQTSNTALKKNIVKSIIDFALDRK